MKALSILAFLSLAGIAAHSDAGPIRPGECSRTHGDYKFTKFTVNKFYQCTRNQALQLSLSGEEASSIATAAISLCRTELIIALDELEKCNGAQFALDMEPGLKAEARERAIETVVTARATR